MGFFDALRRALTGGAGEDRPFDPRLAEAWGLETPGVEGDLPPAPGPDAFHGSEYDRAQWQKRLKRILDELPETAAEYPDLVADGKALGFPKAWMEECAREEFDMLIRRAVADRVFTEAEHRKVELARIMIDIPEADATARLHAVVAEAEQFFGGKIEEG